MLVKFEHNSMDQTTRNFELFDQKTNKQSKAKQNKTKQKNRIKKENGFSFFKTIFDKALTPFWKMFPYSFNNCLMFN